MGLYLCIFDHDENELLGYDFGSYAMYNEFLSSDGSHLHSLVSHHDSDGSIAADSARTLLAETEINTGPSPQTLCGTSFFEALRNLCKKSIETGFPIEFQ